MQSLGDFQPLKVVFGPRMFLTVVWRFDNGEGVRLYYQGGRPVHERVRWTYSGNFYDDMYAVIGPSVPSSCENLLDLLTRTKGLPGWYA